MEAANELVYYAKKLKQFGLVSEGCNKGSISVRTRENQFLIAPSKLDYDCLKAEMLNLMDTEGKILEENGPISRDASFHQKIYGARGDVHCIIHTHSSYATALALAGREIPFILMGMKFHFNGNVRLSDFYMPGDPKMNEEIVSKLEGRKAVLIKNHGTVCVGSDIKDAFENAVILEELSKSYVNALQISKVDTIKEL